ncbi:tyrosine-type recombinase/integrase [Granulicella paludicola]|uniref:tyrosine-type recombinase/integrase n=1 Tax=Granulicella paludicola TaxID=474951 RepID=UPI0021DFC29E|nr:site-specific integrase [Granulicella paludicola]
MARGRKHLKVKGVYERPEGSGNWYARYRVDGKWVRKSFGEDHAAAVSYAEKARTIRRSGEGVLPRSAKKHVLTFTELNRHATGITLGKLCDDFLAYVKAHPEEYRDQKNPPRRIREIKDEFGDRPAASIKSSEIEDWLDAVQEDRELANATINKLRGTFSKIYRHGRRKDQVDVNPAVDVPLKHVGNGVERFLSADEEERLRAVLNGWIEQYDPEQHPQLRKEAIQRLLEFEVSVKSGIRKSEQYNLVWPDIDFNRRVMRLRVTKNGKPRNAYIIDDVAKALNELLLLSLERRGRSREQPSTAPKDSVFAKGENKKWWAEALRQAKIENYRWHDNRHTFCSRLVQAGVHLKVVQEAAGHSSIASTMRYAHFAPSQVLDAMAVLNHKAA